MPRPAKIPDQACSAARAAAVLADPWVMLLLRETFRGARRFDELVARTGAARSVVAARLKTLVAEGLLQRHRYQARPPRDEYTLSPAGRDAFPVLMTLMAWGDRHRAPAGPPALLRHRECGQHTAPGLHCSACGALLRPESLRLEPGPGSSGLPLPRPRQRAVM